jgi:hypothetical protein
MAAAAPRTRTRVRAHLQQEVAQPVQPPDPQLRQHALGQPVRPQRKGVLADHARQPLVRGQLQRGQQRAAQQAVAAQRGERVGGVGEQCWRVEVGFQAGCGDGGGVFACCIACMCVFVEGACKTMGMLKLGRWEIWRTSSVVGGEITAHAYKGRSAAAWAACLQAAPPTQARMTGAPALVAHRPQSPA